MESCHKDPTSGHFGIGKGDGTIYVAWDYQRCSRIGIVK